MGTLHLWSLLYSCPIKHSYWQMCMEIKIFLRFFNLKKIGEASLSSPNFQVPEHGLVQHAALVLNVLVARMEDVDEDVTLAAVQGLATVSSGSPSHVCLTAWWSSKLWTLHQRLALSVDFTLCSWQCGVQFWTSNQASHFNQLNSQGAGVGGSTWGGCCANLSELVSTVRLPAGKCSVCTLLCTSRCVFSGYWT